MYDVIIIGSGVAGLSAAIYTGSRSLKTAMFEQADDVGGVIRRISNVTHFPGVDFNERGDSFISRIKEQVNDAGTEIFNERVQSVNLKSDPKVVTTDNGKYEAKKIIIANGTRARRLDCHNDENDSLISYDAFADSDKALGKEIFVVGGSDGALKESIFLASLSSKVHLTHQRNKLTAIENFVEEAEAKKNIEIHLNTRVHSVEGDGENTKVTLKNVDTGEEEVFEGKHFVFAYIGGVPNTEIYDGTGLELDERQYVVTDREMKTNIPGVYAAGDIVSFDIRQISVSAGEGTIAALKIADEIAGTTTIQD